MKKGLAAASAAAIAVTALGTVPAASAGDLPAPAEQTAGIEWFGHTAHVKAKRTNKAVIKVRYQV